MNPDLATATGIAVGSAISALMWAAFFWLVLT
jgi:hypothetical protein